MKEKREKKNEIDKDTKNIKIKDVRKEENGEKNRERERSKVLSLSKQGGEGSTTSHSPPRPRSIYSSLCTRSEKI